MLTQLNSAIQAADITKNGLPTFVVLESTSNSEDLNLQKQLMQLLRWQKLNIITKGIMARQGIKYQTIYFKLLL